MECGKYSKLISTELDGLLNKEDTLLLDEHCKTCSDCCAERKKAAEIQKICSDFSSVKLDDDFKIQLAKPGKSSNLKKILLISGSIAAAIVILSTITIKISAPDVTRVMLDDNKPKQTYSAAVPDDETEGYSSDKAEEISETLPESTSNTVSDNETRKETPSEATVLPQEKNEIAESEKEEAAVSSTPASDEQVIIQHESIAEEDKLDSPSDKAAAPESAKSDSGNMSPNTPQESEEYSSVPESENNDTQNSQSVTDSTPTAESKHPAPEYSASSGGAGGGSSLFGADYTEENSSSEQPSDKPELINLITSDESRSSVYDAIAISAPEIESVSSSGNFSITVSKDQFESIVNNLNSNSIEFVISQLPQSSTLTVTFVFQTSAQEKTESMTETTPLE